MRILHTMLRVGDLDAALRFYQNGLGMALQRRYDYDEGRFTRAFVGYGDEQRHAAIELTHNWDKSGYALGEAFGHLAVEVDNAARVCERVRALGYRVTRDAGPMKHGRNVIAFVEDPDGHKIELIEQSPYYD